MIAFIVSAVGWYLVNTGVLGLVLAAAAIYYVGYQIVWRWLVGQFKGKAPKTTDQPWPQYDIPEAEEDRTVPEVFGTYKVGLNLLHIGEPEYSEIVERKRVKTGKGDHDTTEQVVGHAVHVSQVLYGIGMFIDWLTGWYHQQELVWTGKAGNGQTVSLKTGTSAESHGSGFSRSNGTINSGAFPTFPTWVAGSGDPVVYYTIACIYFPNLYIGDNVQGPGFYAARCQRIVYTLATNTSGVDRDLAEITHETGLVSQNPAFMLYYILHDWLGVPDALIDKDSFVAAAETLKDEGLGFFCMLDKAEPAHEIVEELLRHVEGVLIFSQHTSKWTFKLTRRDYDIEDVIVLGPEHFADLSVSRNSWEDLPTTIAFKYLDLDRWDLAVYDVANDAVEYAVGTMRKATHSFPWFAGGVAFEQVVARLMRRNFRPMATVHFSLPEGLRNPITGERWLPEEGDVVSIRYAHPTGAFSFDGMVLRIMGVTRGLREKRVKVEAVEDIFTSSGIDLVGLPDVDPSGASYVLNDPVSAVIALDPVPELADGPAVGILAAPPATGRATNYIVRRGDPIESFGPFNIVPRGVLAAPGLPAATRWADPDATLNVTAAAGTFTAVSHSYAAWQRLASPAVLVDDDGNYEIVSVRQVVHDGGSNWRLVGLIRDCAGSGWRLDGGGLKEFATGNAVWLLPSRNLRAVFDMTGALNEAHVYEVIATNHFDASPATSISHTYGGAAETPYPVGFLAGARDGTDHVLTWVAHNRRRGMTAFNMDAVPVFDDVLETGLMFEVSVPADTGFTPVLVTSPAYTRASAPGTATTYRVRAVLFGRFSEPREITL